MKDEVEYVRVANFDTMQHYKDRSPAWIKLYLKLSENVRFCALTDTSKIHLIGLWMTAAKLENRIPNTRIWLNRSNMSKRPVKLEPLLKAGFVERIIEETDTIRASKTAIKVARPLEEKRREEKKKATPLPDKPARKPDPLWDTLVAELGVTPTTPSERGRWNKALKGLREADATPAQIRCRCKVYRFRWPNVSLTATALEANWGSLLSDEEIATARREERLAEVRAMRGAA